MEIITPEETISRLAQVEKDGIRKRQMAMWTAWGSVILAALVFGALIFAANRQLSIKKQELSTLQRDIADLEKAKSNLAAKVDVLAHALSTTNLSTRKELVDNAENAKYSVGLYGLNVDSSKFEAAKTYFVDQGYTLVNDGILPQREPWMSPTSAVFYYRAETAPKARQIASDLRKLTGESFEVKGGAGFGIPKGQEIWNVRVHYISASAQR